MQALFSQRYVSNTGKYLYLVFFAGACAAPAPGAGYDPERYDAGAWVSAAGCVRLFFGEIFVSSSRFFAEWRNKSFAGLATSGVCRSLLSQLTIPPNPLNFFYYQSMFSTEPFQKSSFPHTPFPKNFYRNCFYYPNKSNYNLFITNNLKYILL